MKYYQNERLLKWNIIQNEIFKIKYNLKQNIVKNEKLFEMKYNLKRNI